MAIMWEIILVDWCEMAPPAVDDTIPTQEGMTGIGKLNNWGRENNPVSSIYPGVLNSGFFLAFVPWLLPVLDCDLEVEAEITLLIH